MSPVSARSRAQCGSRPLAQRRRAGTCRRNNWSSASWSPARTRASNSIEESAVIRRFGSSERTGRANDTRPASNLRRYSGHVLTSFSESSICEIRCLCCLLVVTMKRRSSHRGGRRRHSTACVGKARLVRCRLSATIRPQRGPASRPRRCRSSRTPPRSQGSGDPRLLPGSLRSRDRAPGARARAADGHVLQHPVRHREGR